MENHQTLIRYLRVVVFLLIVLVGWLMVDTYNRTRDLGVTPISEVSVEERAPQFSIPDAVSVVDHEPAMSALPTAEAAASFITNPSPPPSPEYLEFWSLFDESISRYVAKGDEDSMKFQRASIRRSFLDNRGLLVDQDTGRVFTRTGVLVSIETLTCHLSGFDATKPHLIANCP